MSLAEELQKLDALRASGAISEHEFALAKARVLQGTAAPAAPVDSGGSFTSSPNFLHRLTRSNRDYWLGGVCGGLGEHTPIPGWGWRLIFCALVVLSGIGII